MRKSWIVLGLLAACANRGYLPPTPHGEKVLEVRGALKYGTYALGRADLARLPRRTVRGVDPVTGRTATWEGVSVVALVIERVELAKSGADTAIVRTADRSAIPIPLTVIRQWRPVLADRADGEPLATPVLAWPTLEQRGIETDPRSEGWWARDVVAFELADWQRALGPSLAAPDGSPDAARRGASFYADRCLRCHRVRGAGGERGPDLTTVAARLGQGAFASLLDRHPGWKGPVGEPAGPETADELWSFLRVVAASPAVVPPPKPADPVTADRSQPEPNSP
jgi:mono/diheme cytochrome c family protein